MADLLLVDNDARIVELMTWFLVKRGHVVRAAASFAEARERVRERAPDLMLSDIDLGVESGRDALPSMARAGLLPPTLVVSGYVDRELTEALAHVPGIVGLLAKPVSMAALEARVVALVGSRTSTVPFDVPRGVSPQSGAPMDRRTTTPLRTRDVHE